MKTLIIALLVLLSFSLNASIGNGIPSLIENEYLTLSLENETNSSMFQSATYNVNENCIALEFNEKLELIHLFNEKGETEMLFPVASNKVNLGLSLFESGNYKMGFTIEGKEGLQFADISIN